MNTNIRRRTALRGILAGTAVSVGLPYLDCFLNTNGTALANGAPMPVRFGSWFWALSMTPGRWVPTKIGADYDLLPELKPIEAHKKKITLFSGFNVNLDGRPNSAHASGVSAFRTGNAPNRGGFEGPTFDTLISSHIGRESRFRAIDMCATGDPKDSYSRISDVINPGEVSPVALYKRIFGAEFKDPNAAEFTPDPQIMLRKSVLSAVLEQGKDTMKHMGQADRIRMDQYFTSIRQLEQQLALQLQKPAPAEACVITKAPEEGAIGADFDTIRANHTLMGEMTAMALACNQTKVFNMVFTDLLSRAYRRGEASTSHTITHEEPIDEKLGYQPISAWFSEQSMTAWAQFVGQLDAIKEGDRTLLDNTLVLAHTETGYAKIHSYANMPTMLAGSAGGKIKTGLHIAGNGDPVTRIGLTAQQIMGVPVTSWGSLSMETSKTVSEIFV